MLHWLPLVACLRLIADVSLSVYLSACLPTCSVGKSIPKVELNLETATFIGSGNHGSWQLLNGSFR